MVGDGFDEIWVVGEGWRRIVNVWGSDEGMGVREVGGCNVVDVEIKW